MLCRKVLKQRIHFPYFGHHGPVLGISGLWFLLHFSKTDAYSFYCSVYIFTQLVHIVQNLVFHQMELVEIETIPQTVYLCLSGVISLTYTNYFSSNKCINDGNVLFGCILLNVRFSESPPLCFVFCTDDFVSPIYRYFNFISSAGFVQRFSFKYIRSV